MSRLGVIAIARPTFDVEFACGAATAAFQALVDAGHEVVGSPEPAMDLASIDRGIEALSRTDLDALVVLQASFADTSLVMRAAELEVPLVLWAFPEERTGERLRLNSFCGINLAGYALTNLGHDYGWLFRTADDREAAGLVTSLVARRFERAPIATVTSLDNHSVRAMAAATAVRDQLRNTTIGRVGERPDGFEPCAYDRSAAREILGVKVDEVPLPELFARAGQASADDVARARATRQRCSMVSTRSTRANSAGVCRSRSGSSL